MKPSLKLRASHFFQQVIFGNKICLDPQASIEMAWREGYKAAKRDVHRDAYARRLCQICAKPRDGHRHAFCQGCLRPEDHCVCKRCPDCHGRHKDRKLYYKKGGHWYCQVHLMVLALRGKHQFGEKHQGQKATFIKGMRPCDIGEERGDP